MRHVGTSMTARASNAQSRKEIKMYMYIPNGHQVCCFCFVCEREC
jgi:hypothetical protein